MFPTWACGAILHPGQVAEGVPPDGLVGQWGSYASCIVIRANYVLSTKHQGGGVGTAVRVDGRVLRVAEQWEHDTADLVVSRLIDSAGRNPGLAQTAVLPDGTSEMGWSVAIGGYGRGRGEEMLDANSEVYGYKWGSYPGRLVWGWNKVDRLYSMVDGDPAKARGIAVSFEPAGDPEALAGEVALAQGDSGGGWFAGAAGNWTVVAMSTSVEHSGESWFASPTGSDDPDMVFGLRLSPTVGWIESLIFDNLIGGDVNGDGKVNFQDYLILTRHFGRSGGGWDKGDFDGNGVTDHLDLDILLQNYGQITPAEDPAVPEPGSLVLVLLGGPLVLRRR
ncbi:MAG: dockerin type I domain-containing protein [Phycisphaerae bacterium]